MLALRLTDGYKDPGEAANNGPFSTLGDYMGSFLSTLLYPSEQGQLRTPKEVMHTIELYTDNLETTEFGPSAAKGYGPVIGAYRAVKDYFK